MYIYVDSDEAKQIKKRRKRHGVIAFLFVLLIGVILSTSTYAWFTSNRTITIENITVNVSTVSGVQVCIDGIDWKSSITNDDIINAHNTYPNAVNQFPNAVGGTVNPVSTVGNIDTSTGFMEMFAGVLEQNFATDYVLTARRSIEEDGVYGDFIVFDLFIKVDVLTPIYLTSNSGVMAEGDSTGIENAARIGFVYQGNQPATSDVGVIQNMRSNGSVRPFIWEVNNDVHTTSGIENARSVYGIFTEPTGAARINYFGVKTQIPSANNVYPASTDPTYFGPSGVSLSTAKAGISPNAYESLMTLQAGITKVRIYMWIEGQDVDCESGASGGSITYSLQLSSDPSGV